MKNWQSLQHLNRTLTAFRASTCDNEEEVVEQSKNSTSESDGIMYVKEQDYNFLKTAKLDRRGPSEMVSQSADFAQKVKQANAAPSKAWNQAKRVMNRSSLSGERSRFKVPLSEPHSPDLSLCIQGRAAPVAAEGGGEAPPASSAARRSPSRSLWGPRFDGRGAREARPRDPRASSSWDLGARVEAAVAALAARPASAGGGGRGEAGGPPGGGEGTGGGRPAAAAAAAAAREGRGRAEERRPAGALGGGGKVSPAGCSTQRPSKIPRSPSLRKGLEARKNSSATYRQDANQPSNFEAALEDQSLMTPEHHEQDKEFSVVSQTDDEEEEEPPPEYSESLNDDKIMFEARFPEHMGQLSPPIQLEQTIEPIIPREKKGQEQPRPSSAPPRISASRSRSLTGLERGFVRHSLRQPRRYAGLHTHQTRRTHRERGRWSRDLARRGAAEEAELPKYRRRGGFPRGGAAAWGPPPPLPPREPGGGGGEQRSSAPPAALPQGTPGSPSTPAAAAAAAGQPESPAAEEAGTGEPAPAVVASGQLKPPAAEEAGAGHPATAAASGGPAPAHHARADGGSWQGAPDKLESWVEGSPPLPYRRTRSAGPAFRRWTTKVTRSTPYIPLAKRGREKAESMTLQWAEMKKKKQEDEERLQSGRWATSTWALNDLLEKPKNKWTAEGLFNEKQRQQRKEARSEYHLANSHLPARMEFDKEYKKANMNKLARARGIVNEDDKDGQEVLKKKIGPTVEPEVVAKILERRKAAWIDKDTRRKALATSSREIKTAKEYHRMEQRTQDHKRRMAERSARRRRKEEEEQMRVKEEHQKKIERMMRKPIHQHSLTKTARLRATQGRKTRKEYFEAQKKKEDEEKLRQQKWKEASAVIKPLVEERERIRREAHEAQFGEFVDLPGAAARARATGAAFRRGHAETLAANRRALAAAAQARPALYRDAHRPRAQRRPPPPAAAATTTSSLGVSESDNDSADHDSGGGNQEDDLDGVAPISEKAKKDVVPLTGEQATMMSEEELRVRAAADPGFSPSEKQKLGLLSSSPEQSDNDDKGQEKIRDEGEEDEYSDDSVDNQES